MYLFKEINICAKIQLIWIKYTNIRYQKYVLFAQIMHVLPEKSAVKHEGVQISKLLLNYATVQKCKHKVCKIVHIILLLDV